MIRVCHVLSDDAGWAERIALGQLLAKGGRSGPEAMIAGTPGVARWPAVIPGELERFSICPNTPFLDSASLSLRLRRRDVDGLHAWGVRSASIAAPAARHLSLPLLVHLHAPPARRAAKKLRNLTAESGASFLCASQIIRRRLIEGGIADERCVVIRPGVDFGAINEWRRSPGSAGLGADTDDFVVALGAADPADRIGALVGVGIFRRISGRRVRAVLMPGAPDADRLLRFARMLPDPDLLIPSPGMGGAALRARRDSGGTTPDLTREQTVALSDAYLLVPRGDTSTIELAWAMAGRTAIVATAEYAIAELIAHKLNGMLIKRDADRSIAPAIARALSEGEAMGKNVETAHGQAFEVFSVRRFVDQVRAVYDNVGAGRPLGEGVVDSASAA